MYIGSQFKFILIILFLLFVTPVFILIDDSKRDFKQTQQEIKLTFPKNNHNFTQIPIESRIKIESGDSLYSLLKELDIKEDLINTIILDDNLKEFSRFRIDETLLLRTDSKTIRIIKYRGKQLPVILEINSDSYSIFSDPSLFHKYVFFKEFKITDSLYQSGINANVPDVILADLIYIFGWDIDFAFDIREGDSVKILYEDTYFNGNFLFNGDILAAEFINNGEEISAIRFSQKGRKDYYAKDSSNIRKAFLKTPIEFAKISSHYNLKRKHPVLNTIRAHKGTDYAAKKGTPVKVTGDGVVTRADYSESYGNIIDVLHFNTYTTRYAHLNNFSNNIKVGTKVLQGDVIGYVGSTGLATGPHLHYEFHINGKHTNPVNIKPTNAAPINSYNLDNFNKIVNERSKLIDNLSNNE